MNMNTGMYTGTVGKEMLMLYMYTVLKLLLAVHTPRHTDTYLPEPDDDLVLGSVAIVIDRVLPPVFHIDVCQTTH